MANYILLDTRYKTGLDIMTPILLRKVGIPFQDDILDKEGHLESIKVSDTEKIKHIASLKQDEPDNIPGFESPTQSCFFWSQLRDCILPFLVKESEDLDYYSILDMIQSALTGLDYSQNEIFWAITTESYYNLIANKKLSNIIHNLVRLMVIEDCMSLTDEIIEFEYEHERK